MLPIRLSDYRAVEPAMGSHRYAPLFMALGVIFIRIKNSVKRQNPNQLIRHLIVMSQSPAFPIIHTDPQATGLAIAWIRPNLCNNHLG